MMGIHYWRNSARNSAKSYRCFSSKLGFGVVPVNGHVRYTWKRGEGWDQGQVFSSPYINLHANAGALHYGLAVFEGLKAFQAKDGNHYICNPFVNARRMRTGARRLVMPEVPEELFVSAVSEAVSLNREFIPDYVSRGSLYIRPLLFASGPMLPLKPAEQFSFIVTVTPVGNYFGSSAGEITAAVVDLDRAAPRGTGAVKAAGNYASDMFGLNLAKTQYGCDTTLYLDAQENRFIEEFSVANFVGIKNGIYVTPNTPSVLPSITNEMLMKLAEDEGIPVQRRPIDFSEEIQDFSEVAGSGTAVVLSPIKSIRHNDTTYEFESLNILGKLRDRLVRIQRGEEKDVFNWMHPVPTQETNVESDPEGVLRRMLCAVSSDQFNDSEKDTQFNECAVKSVYDQLAGYYQKAGGDRVVAAAHCSSLLLNFLPVSRRGRVLDAGAGTGEAGSMLKAAGVRHLTAYDLSDNMLDHARKRGVYNNLVQGCLPDCPFEDAAFDAVVCAGCLAPGHASPATYAEFCRIVRPGGLVAFSIPEAYLEAAEGLSHKFAIETLERVGTWEKVFEETRSYFDDVEAMYYVFKRLDSSPQLHRGEEDFVNECRDSFYVFP